MGKDPAFLFYPGDWMGGTMGMTFEEKGCYLELLMMQFNNGKFTEQQVKQVLSVCFPHAWPTLKHKFQTDGTYYWNERLQIEIEKRSKFIESRRLSGLTPKKEKAYAKHTLKRGENENRNDNRDRIKYGEFVSMTTEQYNKLVSAHGRQNTQNLIDILDNYKGATGKKYTDDYRAILKWVVDAAKKEGKYIVVPEFIKHPER